MKKISLFVLTLLLSSILYSCGSITYITDTWEKQGFSGKKFNKVLVMAVAKENMVARRLVEDAVVGDLRARGINAIVSYDQIAYDIFDKDKDGKVDDTKEAEEMIKAKVKELSTDGLLVLALKDVKKDTKYVKGAPYYTPTYYYTPYYSYYFETYDRLYSPGYYTKNTDVYIESSVYDVQKEELVYSLMSETANPQSLGDFTKSYSKALSTTLVDQKVLLT